MEIRVEHVHTREEALRRLREAAGSMELDLSTGVAEGADAYAGEVKRSTPLGEVRASYAIVDGAILIAIAKKPAFLPGETLRRAIEDGLRRALAE